MPAKKKHFIASAPWIWRAEGDPPDLDYSVFYEAVCPIYYVKDDGEDRRFLFDLKVQRGDEEESSALAAVQCRAFWTAMVLNTGYDDNAGHRAAFAGFFAEFE